MSRRVQSEDPPVYDYDNEAEGMIKASLSNASEDQEPFMGMKARTAASRRRDLRGDYIDVSSFPYLMKIIQKQGDNQVLFADRVMKFTGSGKVKRRLLLITDFAIYVIDPESGVVKRRVVIATVERIMMSELKDNFFAIIVPREYDLLMASTRKTEIVSTIVEATKTSFDYELDVVFSNSFEYHAAAKLVNEVRFEDIDGGVNTVISKK